MNWFSRWRNCSWLTVYVVYHSPNKHVPKELNHRPVVSITSRCSEIYGSPTVQTVNAWQERMTFENIGPVATGFQQSNSWIKRRTFKPQGTRDTDIRATAVWLQTRIPLGNDLLSPDGHNMHLHTLETNVLGFFLHSKQQRNQLEDQTFICHINLPMFSRTKGTFRISHAFSGPKCRGLSIM